MPPPLRNAYRSRGSHLKWEQKATKWSLRAHIVTEKGPNGSRFGRPVDKARFAPGCGQLASVGPRHDRLEPRSGRPGGRSPPPQEGCVSPRFLELADVAEELSISVRQAYTLVRSGELPAIQVGGRGQWRVETAVLEEYIQRKYAETREMVRGRPSGEAD
nr:helix-turn-helix domain-containing protein [Kineosporia rhizophila]